MQTQEGMERIYFACQFEVYQLVQQAMTGLRAYEAETTFYNGYIYFYAVVHKDDVAEFNRRLEEFENGR